ncbi:hypothetical protein F5Y17DRAFT_387309 [Xylariaceae sp. FL0594]|nr:hypothetical protein F5Y17DRAFT_387309 [Xylariaceae sp. FL0594]
MSEYWKSTPKYWCKHCSTYVRDTKLERKNHESTAKHQSALKRFLRDLHRGHENELREKDRAKREIDRLNGIHHPPPPTYASASTSSSSSSSNPNAIPVIQQRQQQWEQLAELGVDLPTEIRKDMAMPGEWQVTSTRIINDAPPPPPTPSTSDTPHSRKRVKEEEDDDEEDHEDSVRNLFKKPRKWGRDARHAGDVDDAELDALLSAPLVTKPQPPIKEEKEEKEVKEEEVKREGFVMIKKEEPDDANELLSAPPTTTNDIDGQETKATVKEEEEKPVAEPELPAVVFKKRKPKNVRQK